MDKSTAIALVSKIEHATEDDLLSIGQSISLCDADGKIKSLLFEAIEIRRSDIKTGIASPMVEFSEVDLDNE